MLCSTIHKHIKMNKLTSFSAKKKKKYLKFTEKSYFYLLT